MFRRSGSGELHGADWRFFRSVSIRPSHGILGRLRGNQIIKIPEAIREASGHCGRYAQGLVNSDEVVPGEVQAEHRPNSYPR